MKELLGKYIDVLLKPPLKINIENDLNGGLSITFLQKYKILDDKPKGFLINSFHKVGWSDPFPEDFLMMTNKEDKAANEKLRENQNHLVYPHERIFGRYSP